MSNDSIQAASNPALGNTRWGDRPLNPKELMQRMAVLCAASSPKPTCTGQVFVGMFFDGTGNNMKEDYEDFKDDPRHQKHSNVVRLFNAHPGQRIIAGNGYYRYYMPGLGTPFPEIGDAKDQMQGATQKMGAAMALYGAARVVWGLTRVFNAVSQYCTQSDLISDAAAKQISNEVSHLWAPNLYNNWMRNSELRDTWVEKLKARIKGTKPELTQITINVFGFSRGAAEARAFVNWLFQICKQEDGGAWTFAGIPLQVQFLGIFDTVSSVGVAGLYSLTEGRQGWADSNMQVHPAVQQCLHMVAGHEVRSCFPLDSARIDAKYPSNVKEYIYPGSHSDVGGGYMPMALGKKNWTDGRPPADLQLARIPGYEMYCAARAAGVPFRAPEQLPREILEALKPSKATVDAFDAYCKSVAIAPGPVEDMARQHMSLYFTHRWAQAAGDTRPELARAKTLPNRGETYDKEVDWMHDTQVALIQVIAAICQEVDRLIGLGGMEDMLNNPYAFDIDASDVAKGYFGWVGGVVAGGVVGGAPGALGGGSAGAVEGTTRRARQMREKALRDRTSIDAALQVARQAPEYLKRWKDGWRTEMRDVVVERDALSLLEALRTTPLPAEATRFFDELVHDSMAGFIGFGMPEFEWNGYGIAKFRRIFFGNKGDEILRKRAAQQNEQRRANASAARAAAIQAAERYRPARVPTIGEVFNSFPRH